MSLGSVWKRKHFNPELYSHAAATSHARVCEIADWSGKYFIRTVQMNAVVATEGRYSSHLAFITCPQCRERLAFSITCKVTSCRCHL